MYMSILLSVLLLVVFYKIGDLEENIGTVLGLIAGALIIAANLFFPMGLLGLILYAIAGFALLTVYKLVRSILEKRKY